MIANAHSMKLIINIPLKTPTQHFTLYQIITLPERIFVDRFFQYSIDFPYLGLQTGQRNYILLTEAEFNKCTKGDITVCPANTAVYGARQLTCEHSLFFQTES